MEPTEEEIGLVIDFASLDPVQDRTVVIQALKSNGRDTQRVLQEYFEDATSFTTKYLNATQWDDGMFSGDRNGGDSNGGFSYHVEAPPEHDVIQGIDPMDGSAPGAPSRPPSRTNSKSPLGKVVDWATADTHGVPSSQAQEDEDMERALRVSRQEAGIPAQENGVVDNSTAISNFGPANRDHYEQNNWAMVPTGPQKTLTSHAPPASARKRATGAPAFMVQGFSNSGLNHLGGLLTILHEVPLARNILLSLGEPAATYGHNSEWWNGQEILPDHVLAKMASGELQWGEQDESLPNLENEIHRIMAFLDSTERSYGTVSVLSGMIGADRGAEKQFYETIAFRNAEKITQLTQVAALCEVHGESLTEEEVANFGMLDMEHPRSEYSTIKTLYESLDHVMWNDALTWNEIHEGTKMATFKQIGETLVLKVGGDGPEDSIEIPLELYPEKYLSDRRAESGRIQAAWVETKVQAEQLQQAQQTLTIWRDEWDSKKYDKKHLVQKAMGQWKAYHAYLDSLGRYRSMENSGFDTHKYPSHHAAPVDATEKEGMLKGQVDEAIRSAEKLVEDIDSRLQWLQSESKRVFEKQRYIGRLLTDPSKGRPRPMSCKKYLLRGVATTIDVIYVCRRSEPDLIELDDTPKPRDQWWRLSRSPDQDQVVEKVEAERVLRDMWQETKTPLLVYATEDALNTTPEPLSGPLERFVKADNKSFRQELNQEQFQANDRPPPATEVVSPSKRKHRADSLDSMNSNRASLGSIDMEDREDPFADNGGAAPDLLGQEMEERQSSRLADPAGIQDQPFAAIELEQQQPGQSIVAEPEMTTAPETGETVTSTPSGTRNPTPSTTTQGGEFSRTLSPDAEAGRSPEMQEKSRPPTFMTSPPRGGEKAQTAGAMDMELPHNQE